MMRRGRTDELLRLGLADLEMDLVTRRVTRGGQALELTVREFELLEYLLRHLGQVVSREMLVDVWKEVSRATPLDNVIDVNVARLRKKVDQGFGVKLIHTVRGVGFAVREGARERAAAAAQRPHPADAVVHGRAGVRPRGVRGRRLPLPAPRALPGPGPPPTRTWTSSGGAEVTYDGHLAWQGSGHPDEAEGSATLRGRWLRRGAGTGSSSCAARPTLLALEAPGSAERKAVTILHAGAPLRVSSAVRAVAGAPVVLRAARSEAALRRELRELALVQGIGLPIALALAALGVYQMARRVLAPVARMVERARHIGRAAGRAASGRELGRRAGPARRGLQRHVRPARAVLRPAPALHRRRVPRAADASHRPPQRRGGRPPGASRRQALRRGRGQHAGGSRSADASRGTLLALSRADAGQVRLAREPIDLTSLAQNVVHHLEDLAQEKGQRLEVEAEGESNSSATGWCSARRW